MTIENNKNRKLWNKAYTCQKNTELKSLLHEIETKIKQKGPNSLLLRAKTVTTTKLLLNKEK